MYFDDLLTNHVGEMGKAQVIILIVAAMTNFPVAFNNLGIVFLAASPDHWCSVPELDNLNLTVDYIKNVTIPTEEKDGVIGYSSCHQYNINFTGWSQDDLEDALRSGNQEMWETTPCQNGWNYDVSIYKSTIVTQWDLVCDKTWLQATSSAVYMVGLMVGVFGLGTVSDMIGRLPTLWICLLLEITFSIAAAFSPSILIFIILRFFLGIFSISLSTTAHVLLMEVVGPSWRVFASITAGYLWCTGYAVVAGIAYGLRQWFHLQLAFTSAPLLLIAMFFLLHESPRWLYVQRKADKADQIIRRMGHLNNNHIPDIIEIQSESTKKAFVWDLFKTKHLKRLTANLYFQWFVTSFVYYGLSLNTSNLGGNDFINFFIAAAVEFPAHFLGHRALVTFGRRIPLSFALVSGGVAMFGTMAVPEALLWLKILIAMYGKFCISGAFTIFYIYTVELFPTVIRNTALGSCSFFARIGGTISPYVIQLAVISKYIPFIVYGVLCVVVGCLVILLPETKGKRLPETLEDGETFLRSGKLPSVMQSFLEKTKQKSTTKQVGTSAAI